MSGKLYANIGNRLRPMSKLRFLVGQSFGGHCRISLFARQLKLLMGNWGALSPLFSKIGDRVKL